MIQIKWLTEASMKNNEQLEFSYTTNRRGKPTMSIKTGHTHLWWSSNLLQRGLTCIKMLKVVLIAIAPN